MNESLITERIWYEKDYYFINISFDLFKYDLL